ncbi:MAG: tail fiber domain-containing protein, partial [Bacteroidota bacterium]
VFGTNNVERLRIASDASSVTDNLISIPTVSGREIRFTGGTSAASITSDNQLDIGTSANALTLTGSSGILMTGNVSLNGGLPAVSLDITGTDAIRIPAGTDAQRPGTPGTGMIRFNSTSGDYEGYDGAVWNTLGVGGLTLQVAYDGGGNLIQQDGANNLEVLNSAGSLIQFYIDDATNNVGIGTSTPITTLDVRGESVGEGGLLNLGNSDNSHQLTIFSGRDGDPEPFIQVTDGTPLRFATTASSFTEIARFDNLGRFGIGTDLPLSTLDVNGDMRASGHLASSVVGGEGGQITLGHQGNTTATGEGNSTWNIDVESQNLRFFNLDAGGVGSIWMDINASTNLMTIGQTNANIDFRGPLLLSGDVGTAGQVLTSQGAGTPPVWSNASGITNLQGAYDGGGDVMMTAGSNIEVRTTTTSQIPFFIDEATGNVGFNTNAPTNSFEIREAPNQDRVFTVSGRNVALGDVDAGGTGGNMFIDGDGTGNLQYSNGAVWFNGSSGATPTSGSGTRFMWIPSRSSIRAGSIIGTEWDDGNVGSGSAAFGQNNTASGQASTAIGQANTASGSRSFVGGVSSTASGNGSTALGEGVTASTRGGFAVGHYNIGGGSATSFTSTDPVFEVGIGASSGSPENALTVLHGGNVGIGTATPLWGLEVEDNFSSNINPLVNFNRTGSNSATPIRMTNDASFINIGLTQNEDFAVSALGANIGLSGDLLNLDGSTGNLQVGGKIGVNSTTPTNGDIEIKQTTNSVTGSNGVIVTSATASNYWKYHTSGTLLRFSYWNGSVLSTTLSYTSGNSAWTFTSDRRQKKHITSIKTVLEKVLQLNPVRYRYKNMPDDSELNLGFIAQEVEPLFPELVENPNSENSYYSMEYSTVGVIAIKAIQEQQELIENQQKEIDALKAELSKSKLSQNKVETELEALKTQVDKLTNIIQAEAKNNNR